MLCIVILINLTDIFFFFMIGLPEPHPDDDCCALLQESVAEVVIGGNEGDHNSLQQSLCVEGKRLSVCYSGLCCQYDTLSLIILPLWIFLYYCISLLKPLLGCIITLL